MPRLRGHFWTVPRCRSPVLVGPGIPGSRDVPSIGPSRPGDSRGRVRRHPHDDAVAARSVARGGRRTGGRLPRGAPEVRVMVASGGDPVVIRQPFTADAQTGDCRRSEGIASGDEVSAAQGQEGPGKPPTSLTNLARSWSRSAACRGARRFCTSGSRCRPAPAAQASARRRIRSGHSPTGRTPPASPPTASKRRRRQVRTRDRAAAPPDAAAGATAEHDARDRGFAAATRVGDRRARRRRRPPGFPAPLPPWCGTSGTRIRSALPRRRGATAPCTRSG